MPSYYLSELLDFSSLKSMLNDFQPLIGAALILLDEQGKLVCSSGCQEICQNYHWASKKGKKACQDNWNKQVKCLKDGVGSACICKYGLQVNALPIVICDQQMGTLIIEQFLSETPDESAFRAQAQIMGFDEAPYLKALNQVPIIPASRLAIIQTFLNDQVKMFLSRAVERLQHLESMDSLQKVEKDYHYLFNNAQVGIFRTNLADGRILMSNDWPARFLGYEDYIDNEEAVKKGTTLEYFVDPIVREKMLASFVDDEIHDLELPVKKKDGNQVWVSLTGRIDRDLGCIDGVIVDITCRKEAEEAHQESEAHHSSLFNNSHAIMLLSDAKTGDIVDANPAACSFYGYTRETLTGMNLSEINGLPRGQLIQQLTEIVASHLYYFRHRLANGEWRDVDVRRVPVKVKGKKLVYSIINDITERRRWENSLRESERQLADIIEFLPDATFAIDQKGTVIAWNRAAEELCGVAKEKILGQNDYPYAQCIHGERRPILIDLVISPELEEQLNYPVFHREENTVVGEEFCPALGTSGAYMWGKASALYDNQGHIVGAIESMRDITSRRTSALNQERELRKFRVLFDLAIAMTAENSLEENLTLAAEKSRDLLGTDTAFIALLDEEHGDVYMRTLLGIETEDFKNIRMPFGIGLGGLVATRGKGMIVEDYLKCLDISHEPDEVIRKEGLVSGIAVPLQMGKKNLGVLYAYNRQKTDFTSLDLETLTLLGNLTAVEISRRQTEADLLESRQQMADIISFLPDATFSIDKSGQVITWNKAAEELTGVEALQMLGKNQFEYGMVLYGQRRPTLADLVMAPGSEVDSGYTNIYWDGSSLVAENFCDKVRSTGAYLWGKASCLYDSQGKVIGAIESVRDISEHRKATQALRESEQRLSDIINFLPDPTFVIDLEGNVMAWNRAIEEMTGVGAADILHKGNYQHAIPFYGNRQPMLIDLIFQANPDAEKDYFFIQRDNEAWVAETPIPCVKGKKLYLWGKATPLYDSRGVLVGAIESIRDITQRKESEEALQDSYYRLERILEGVVSALGATAEQRDPYTAGHQRRVAQLATGIAQEMDLPVAQIHNIRTASALHDIGKMYIPAEILSKPGKLTEIERLLIKTHPQAGYDIVKSIPFTGQISEILIQHHERMDGSGYPYGLSGHEILLEARIVAVADVVEAMSSHRPYRPAFGLEKALHEIVKNKGTSYDPEVVDACIRLFMEKGFVFDDGGGDVVSGFGY
ncbi:MAG TPA: PAS domain S-box protein [Syntrophomonadaceae bacterium]|nr:PAS domain S-box protein [Syntrophomonadaceae bacterium]